MEFQKLLQKRACDCGRVHSCSIQQVVVESGAIRRLHMLVGSYCHILLVADTNTIATCGSVVQAQLGNRLESVLVYQRAGLLIPNEDAIMQMDAEITEQTDLIIGIGSGVIQDLCKYVSFQRKLPYYIVATAPSMDGYASAGAAMILGGMKVTCSTHVPEMIIGDVDILKDAPMELIQAGYGDILGKYSCLNDWHLSALVRDEYLCETVYGLMFDMLLKTKDLGPALRKREPEAIRTLMEVLVGAGIAMALVGNSRPASGSEHHLSHFFEITGILEDTPYFMHGVDVVYSSVYVQYLRENLLTLEVPPKNQTLTREKWEENIRKIYSTAADGVIALQDKMGWYAEDRYPVYAEKWDQIKQVLSQAPTANEMIRYLESVGLEVSEFEKMYGQTKIENALKFAKDLKDRYTVLWLYYDLLVH